MASHIHAPNGIDARDCEGGIVQLSLGAVGIFSGIESIVDEDGIECTFIGLRTLLYSWLAFPWRVSSKRWDICFRFSGIESEASNAMFSGNESITVSNATKDKREIFYS